MLWLAAGNPYPHGVVVVQVSLSGEPLLRRGDVPWREAGAALPAGLSGVRFAVE